MPAADVTIEQLFDRRQSVIAAIRRVKGHTARAKRKRADLRQTIAQLDRRIISLRYLSDAEQTRLLIPAPSDESGTIQNSGTELVEILENGLFDEEFLETVLILMPQLVSVPTTFLGRQMPTDSGVLDLIAVSEMFHTGHPTLTVFELKARRIQRRDIAQVLDYAL